ncbi:hypothetical protein [Heyndrickxia camelliae]|uniref:hypothetical protein n=1 Tax=Heyndrickxia camelliae TaxID=1707093 RepID=UPI0013FE1A01|nr:hypothetical protein [Heyndrickxia camelliae]
MKKRNHDQEPTIAPGMDDAEELDREATNEEIENGEYTSVTTLSWDEVESNDD